MEAQEPKRPNVVFFIIDTFRADHASCYGYARPTTPNLDALARRGTLFESAFSQSSWSLPSYVTLFTSLYPTTHAKLVPRAVLGTGPATLAEILGAFGYRTAAFVGGGFLLPHFGLGRGFATYWSTPSQGSLQQTVPRAAEWLGANHGKPFFLLIHGYDLHDPYTAPAGFSELFDPDYRGIVHSPGFLYSKLITNIQGGSFDVTALASRMALGTARETPVNPPVGPGGLPYRLPPWRQPLTPADRDHLVAHYDGAIAYSDTWLGLFLEALAARGLEENTVVVVTGDHGEELGEHGRFGHGDLMYDCKIHVPLVVAGPGIASERRVKRVVELIDLAPTTLSLLEIPAHHQHQGRSLAPHLDAAAPAPDDDGGLAFGHNAERYSVRTSRWHLLTRHVAHGPRVRELYDVGADPSEQRNRIADSPELAARLESELRDWLERFPLHAGETVPALPSEERRMLFDLGYW